MVKKVVHFRLTLDLIDANTIHAMGIHHTSENSRDSLFVSIRSTGTRSFSNENIGFRHRICVSCLPLVALGSFEA
jgi:hypothetical protein